jgi:hypothetical protein
MSEKRVVTSESDASTPRETCAARLRLNCLKPNPGWSNQARRYADYHAATAMDGISCLPTNDLSVEHQTRSLGVGMSGQPNPHYQATAMNFRIAYGARALWRRSFHSSLRTGKPSTWRREAGVSMSTGL